MLGPSRQKLAGVLEQTGPVDLFLHDGDHSYESQLEDLRTVWPRLRTGGVVVVDDVWSPAFIEFAAEVGEQASLVVRWDEHDAIGMLRRSG